MMVAINEDIQTKYFQELQPQDPTKLAQKCEILRTRILTRCAGLLETTGTVRNRAYDYSTSFTSRSIRFGSSTHHSEGSEETSSDDESQLVDSENSCSLVNRSPVLHSKTSGGSLDTKLRAQNSLPLYHNVEIKFLHRTARDFLLDTEAGHEIISETSQTRDDRFSNVARARMATLLEGLELFCGGNVENIMWDIGRADTKDEVELLETLRHVCKTLHIPGPQIRDTTLSKFWMDAGDASNDFVGIAARFGCTKYVQWYTDHATTYLSPYYKGFLFMNAVKGLSVGSISRVKEKLRLAIWLADKGADLNTKQMKGNYVTTPFEEFLQVISMPDWPSIPEMAIEVTWLMEKLYPLAVKTKEKFMMYRRLEVELSESSKTIGLEAEIEGNSLYCLALYHLRHNGVIIENIKPVPKSSSTPVKVILIDSSYDRYLRPNVEDMVYLGQAYEKVLFLEDYTDVPAQSLETFSSRLKEVMPRCEKVSETQWEYEMGLRIRLPKNALVLDPSEDVDASNWLERGHFGTVARTPRHGSVFTVMDRTSE